MGGTNFDSIVAIILAGGQNKRMRSKLPKAMHKIGGKPMLGMVYDAVKRIGIKRIVFVVGFGANNIFEYFGGDVEYAYQSEQLGTGHALLTGLEYLNDPAAYAIPAVGQHGGDAAGAAASDTATGAAAADAEAAGAATAPLGIPFNGRVLALYGDMPFISSDTIAALAEQNITNGEQGTLLYADMPDPYGLGRIIRDASGNFVKIIEQKDTTEEEARIREANVGAYCFEAVPARAALKRLGTDNSQGEMYLTDVFVEIVGAGGRVGMHEISDMRECLGANDRVALAEMNRVLHKEKCARLMLDSGVTIIDPDSTYIDQDVEIGMDSIVYPGCVLEGGAEIGGNCVIGPNARISASKVGEGAKIQYSVVTGAVIGPGATIGPFANLRPGSEVGAGTKIGDFVEIKNSNIGEKAAISHLAYIGDADIGSNVNIGCGVITCNYDGKAKHRTTIGSNAFIGSNANLIAPVTVSENSYVASGSTITDDVPEDALAIARGRQVNKEHWVSKKNMRRDGKEIMVPNEYPR